MVLLAIISLLTTIGNEAINEYVRGGGIDSLSAVWLANNMFEKFNIKIPVASLFRESISLLPLKLSQTICPLDLGARQDHQSLDR